MAANTIRAKIRKAGGQRAWRLGSPYGNAAAIPGLHEWAMGRRGETAPSGVLPDLRAGPTEGRNALPEGGAGG